uniref:Phosphopantothenoylcysteine decarboxylase n=1 Tax=Strigomonas galati TaxID=1003336 RepID=T1YTW2_9TRYP|nr:phosphopantothenoylcysteine decarboxylase [Strigomonas galati]
MSQDAASSPPVPEVHTPTTPPSVNLLLLITGSVAAVKLGLLLDELSEQHCNIRMAATRSAFYFLQHAQPSKTGIPFQSILSDEAEWSGSSEFFASGGKSEYIIHIELRKWADLVVIVPLDANTLAKISTGICDNLVTCIMRAWQVREKPVLLCPAMNTAMWEHPVTDTQLQQLTNWYGMVPGADRAMAEAMPESLETGMFQLVGPVEKKLACGDVGMGGMASVQEIAARIITTMDLIRQKKMST